MKSKTLTLLVLAMAIVCSQIAVTNIHAQEPEQEQQQTRVVIPEQVKSVLQQGLATQEARLDIPFKFVNNLFLPAQQNFHSVFFIKVKNSDLGFAAPAAPAEKEEEQEVSSFETTPAQLQTNCHVFLMFSQLDGSYAKEVYIPLNLQADGEGFDAEKEEIYTIGYPLPPGKYMLSMAITNQNLEKIRTQYFEFTLPDPAAFTDTLGTTPAFLIKNINRVASPETVTQNHKDYFTYSVLQIETNLDNVFTAGDNLDVFFFILGAQANEQNRNDIVISYEVKKGEEVLIKYADTSYDSPLISQPLPLKRTVLVRTTKGEETKERKETRDLEPGAYTLGISIKDNLSGKTLIKNIEFSVQ